MSMLFVKFHNLIVRDYRILCSEVNCQISDRSLHKLAVQIEFLICQQRQLLCHMLYLKNLDEFLMLIVYFIYP
jgi:hypothetical protein